MRTLGDMLTKHARLLPAKTAIVCQGTKFTYAQLNANANRLANALLGSGHCKSDRAAVLGHDCHHQVELHFAAARTGGVLVPLNWRLASPEQLYIIDNSQSRTLFVEKEFVPAIDRIRPQLASVSDFICLDGKSEGWQALDEFLGECTADDPGIDVDGNDVVFQFYTSGTTGRPKGAMLTHNNFLHANTNCCIDWGLRRSDVSVVASPIWHAGGATGLHAGLYVGATSIILRPLTPQSVLRATEDFRVSWWMAVPKMLEMILEHPDRSSFDLSSLRLIVYGASPMPPGLLAKLRKTFDVEYITNYGQTETTVMVTCLPNEYQISEGTAEELRRAESIGRETVGVEVRIVDDNDRDVPAREPGEIVMRGPTMMKGYWKLPEATAETLRGGWLHTGDVGYRDIDGLIYLMDRTKDVIRSAGESIFPREVEEVIEMHPAVQEVAVVSAPDERWGEMPVAIVVLKPGMAATEAEIVSLCKENLASFKKPRLVEFRAEPLPKNFTGKILRKDLREPYWKGMERRIG